MPPDAKEIINLSKAESAIRRRDLADAARTRPAILARMRLSREGLRDARDASRRRLADTYRCRPFDPT